MHPTSSSFPRRRKSNNKKIPQARHSREGGNPAKHCVILSDSEESASRYLLQRKMSEKT
jgi:hypothetical protein